MRPIASWRLLLTFALGLPAMVPVQAQVADPVVATGPLLVAADPDVAPSEPSLADQREQLAKRLRLAQRNLPDADSGTDGPEPTSREVELLRQKDLVLQQREAAEESRTELEQERNDIAEQFDDLRESGPSEERPYSFLLLDGLNDALAAEEDRLESRKASVGASTEALERARELADEAAKARRRAKERVATNQDAAVAGKLALALKYARLASELAEATVELRETELSNRRYQVETKQLECQLLEETIALVEQDVTFAQTDLDKQLVELDTLKDAIDKELERNRLAREYLDQQWSAARGRLDAASDPSDALRAEVEARDLAKSLRGEQTQTLNDQLQWLGPMRQTWYYRFRIARGDFSTSQLDDWSDAANSLIDELSYDRRLIDARIDGLRSSLAAVDRRLQNLEEDDDETQRWFSDQQKTLRAAIEYYNDSYIRLEAATRLHERLVGEIERRTSRFSLGEWIAVYWQRLKDVWGYELFTSRDQNPITVGKVVLGALLLLLGFAISKRVSRFVGRRVLPRFGVQEGAAHALGSLTFYALATCAALTALWLVNVPLTVFTFFGGAVAIGVGFGSQRPINNFLSGLILLTERPVRVGDMIQLGDVFGIIETIGTRSTRVRTETNLEIIVPNSALLENNVSNWTLSDPTIRTQVDVGVVYGSPTDKVVEILQSVAEQHLRVLDAPEAFVWFTGFGDNSLLFELHFYIVFRNQTEQQKIESELRLEIDRRFREAGIVVAYPQRDVHLDTAKPLEIRVARRSLEERRKSA